MAPKSYLPNYREFYERRWFAPGDDTRGAYIEVGGDEVPFGPDLVFRATDVAELALHVEICEDMWVPIPPSAEAALAGATVLANLSGSPITIARAEDRRLLVRSASARCSAAYVYAAAGQGESTTDLSWDGQTMVYECGDLLAEGERFPDGARMTVADVDLDRIRQERLRQGTFDDNRRMYDDADRRVPDRRVRAPAAAGDIGLRRKVDRFPFVPDDPERLALDCYEAYNIQVSGLEQRLSAIGAAQGRHRRQRRARLHARADRERPRDGPAGPAAQRHPRLLDAGLRDRRHHPVLRDQAGQVAGRDVRGDRHHRLGRQMLDDIDHPFADGKEVYDVTFENVQAGLRYDYLFRLANHRGGIVVGTGDLSELALGWCTYGVGDQMSHYNVNAGVPKTLVQHLIRWVAGNGEFDEDTNEVLREIVEQEITPELIPTREDGCRSPPRLGRALQPPGLHALPRRPPRRPAQQDRLPRLARLARRRRGGVAARRTPSRGASPTTSATYAAGSTSSSGGSSPASSSGRRCPTGPR